MDPGITMLYSRGLRKHVLLDKVLVFMSGIRHFVEFSSYLSTRCFKFDKLIFGVVSALC